MDYGAGIGARCFCGKLDLYIHFKTDSGIRKMALRIYYRLVLFSI